MVHHTKSSANKSEDGAYQTSKPVFVPGWWIGLNSPQKWLLITFLIFHLLSTILFCVSINEDAYFFHTLRLVGMRPKDYPDQAISYNISITATVGFWHKTVRDNEEYKQDQLSTNAEELMHRHVQIGLELWNLCLEQAHRATTCGLTSFVLLTLGSMGLYSNWLLFVFNRTLTLHLQAGASVFLLVAFALNYATSLEYNNCVIEHQVNYATESAYQFVSYKGRYFLPTLEFNRPSLILLFVNYVFGFIPMLFIITLLIIYYSDNL